MVTYEQGWMDTNGALSLKNNTGVEVKNVVFLITYLDMSGNELDYEEFNKSVSIAPGKTKKIDIPAYEQERFYHYYKSPGNEMEPKTAFKIKFQLKDYNIEGKDGEINSSSLIRGKVEVTEILVFLQTIREVEQVKGQLHANLMKEHFQVVLAVMNLHILVAAEAVLDGITGLM